MTSNSSDRSPPSPEIFSIFSLPSYEDAVKGSPEPPPYEQALTDLRVEDLENMYGDRLPSSNETSPRNRTRRNQPTTQQQQCQRRVYRSFCWGLAILIILVLGYMIYNGIFRYLAGSRKD